LVFFDKLNIGVILVYGAAATGKTTFGLQRALESSKKGKVLFLDAENTFSLERLGQMEKNNEHCLDNILVVKPKSFESLDKQISLFEKISDKFNILILDSFGIFYRLDLKKRGHIETNNIAVNILRKLKHISKKIPVIIINQVYDSEDGRKVLGGKMVRNFSDYIFELQKEPRLIKIEKPAQETLNFKIVNKGLIISS